MLNSLNRGFDVLKHVLIFINKNMHKSINLCDKNMNYAQVHLISQIKKKQKKAIYFLRGCQQKCHCNIKYSLHKENP